MREYELFLDESGRFTEGVRDRERPFPSQIAGLIAPAKQITERTAEEVLQEVFAAAGAPLEELVHATDWPKGPRFDQLVLGLVSSLGRHRDWHPVRLENREGLGFGDIASTYTRMIAELAVRALEHVTRGYDGEVRLRVVAARFMVDGKVQLEANAYETRLQEHLAFAAMRRGLAADSARWKLTAVRFGSGRMQRELQLCDLLSNASHSAYGKLGPAAREALQAAFGELDLRLTVLDLSRRVDGHLDEGSFGLALQALAEELVGGGLSSDAQRAATARLGTVLDRLAALPAAIRGPQLSVLTVWLEQLNEQRRDAALGSAASKWLMDHVEAPLRARLGDRPETLDGFALSLLRQRLTAANHEGAIHQAREVSNQIDALVPRLAGRWEHGPVIIECLVAQSVHLTDSFDHDGAARRMRAVAEYYQTLSSLLSDALEGVFPADVKSEQRGRALGTQMQAEMYAGLSDPLRFEEARRLNEEALREFDSPGDIARQHQYRCQLETFAGELEAAREHLATSLGVDATHAAIATCVVELPPVPQGFALLHWLRLGAAVLGAGHVDDRGSFVAALKSSKVHTLPWCTDPALDYPAHGVRRQLALILARQGECPRALSMLGELRRLEAKAYARPVLALVVAAAHLEVGGLIWGTAQKDARRLLERTRESVKALRGQLGDLLPALALLLQSWDTAVGRVLSGQLDPASVRDELLACGRQVGY